MSFLRNCAAPCRAFSLHAEICMTSVLSPRAFSLCSFGVNLGRGTLWRIPPIEGVAETGEAGENAPPPRQSMKSCPAHAKTFAEDLRWSAFMAQRERLLLGGTAFMMDLRPARRRAA